MVYVFEQVRDYISDIELRESSSASLQKGLQILSSEKYKKFEDTQIAINAQILELMDMFTSRTTEFYDYQSTLTIWIQLFVIFEFFIVWIVTQVIIRRGIYEILRRKSYLVTLIPLDLAFADSELRSVFLEN